MMSDAQNERTKSRSRRRRRRPQRSNAPEQLVEVSEQQRDVDTEPAPVVVQPEPRPSANHSADAPLVRPPDISGPTERIDVYCVHHTAITPDLEPMHQRTRMTTLRHLAVDYFGEATLYCDCLHNGPHEWPPSLQPLRTAIELDQFLADSTNDA